MDYTAAAKPALQPESVVKRDEPGDGGMLSEAVFVRMLGRERKRTERSGRRFVLMLVNSRRGSKWRRDDLLPKAAAVLARTVRETDLVGWHRHGSVVGVIFTEVEHGDDNAVVAAISGKIAKTLYDSL